MCKTMAIRMVVQVKETQPGIDRPQALPAIAQFKDYIILMYTAALLEHLRSSIDISFSLSFNSKKKKKEKEKRKKSPRSLDVVPLSSVCMRSVTLVSSTGRYQPSVALLPEKTILVGLPLKTTIKN